MATINLNYDRLCTCYLFPEVTRRLRSFVEAHPNCELYRLDRSDNTQPLAPSVAEVLHETGERLSKSTAYIECDHYQGEEFLREAISNTYRDRGVNVTTDEIFVNDGAKSDIGNIQSILALTMSLPCKIRRTPNTLTRMSWPAAPKRTIPSHVSTPALRTCRATNAISSSRSRQVKKSILSIFVVRTIQRVRRPHATSWLNSCATPSHFRLLSYTMRVILLLYRTLRCRGAFLK